MADGRELRSRVAVPLVLGAVVLARVPFLGDRLSPDEAGFLMVARQWSPGPSLYGAYWVDRPPLLIGLFQLADLAGGGPVALRLLGTAAVLVSVVLAGLVARTAAPGRPYAAPLASLTAAVFLCDPLFGTTEVDGELLAVPFVLAGLLTLLRAVRATGAGAAGWWVAVGALGVAAASVKQSMLEVLVAAAVVVLGLLRRDRRKALGSGAALLAGALAAAAGLLVWADLHGTGPGPLWDAVVTFREQASALIARSAPAKNQARAEHVLSAFLTSGAVVVLLLAALPRLRRRGPASTPPARPGVPVSILGAVVGWEAFAVAAGGSYWLHYLVGLVPGLVLSSTVVVDVRPARRPLLVGVLGYAAVAAVLAGFAHDARADRPDEATAVERFLDAHERPGDTAVVAFGDPAVLDATGMRSPYPELWSLPTRVRDPRLHELAEVLRGPHRPTWVVVSGAELGTWGVDATRAQPVLEHEYRPAYVAGTWHVYHLRQRQQRAVRG